jgi:hypothetical protein
LAIDAQAMPFPKLEITPPVMNMYFAILIVYIPSTPTPESREINGWAF